MSIAKVKDRVIELFDSIAQHPMLQDEGDLRLFLSTLEVTHLLMDSMKVLNSFNVEETTKVSPFDIIADVQQYVILVAEKALASNPEELQRISIHSRLFGSEIDGGMLFACHFVRHPQINGNKCKVLVNNGNRWCTEEREAKLREFTQKDSTTVEEVKDGDEFVDVATKPDGTTQIKHPGFRLTRYLLVFEDDVSGETLTVGK